LQTSWLWGAVDDEGEVLDVLVQRRRDKAAAVKLMRKLLKKQGFAPEVPMADKLRSYGAAILVADAVGYGRLADADKDRRERYSGAIIRMAKRANRTGRRSNLARWLFRLLFRTRPSSLRAHSRRRGLSR
jgi:transposase-like protein